jgi:tetratricopeptide (TPR) repeat protein
MDNYSPVIYLSVLLVLLSVTAWFLIRQIFKTRRLESNFSKLQSKLSKEKGTAKEYYELGCIYSEKKLFAQAVIVLQKALKFKDEEDPENVALAHNALGYAFSAQEQFDRAIKEFKEAIKLVPNYVVAYNNLGYAYEQKKLTVQAIECYEESLKIDPNNPTAKKRSESLRKRVAVS